MQITIQGSGRRIRFTKGEVAKLKAAATVCGELSRFSDNDVNAATAMVQLECLLARISDDGVYSEAVPEVAGE